tara:strand:+ start:1069 stop:1173 length:105 start_codon:yes stop_codon:yes gene_type:complete
MYIFQEIFNLFCILAFLMIGFAWGYTEGTKEKKR